MGGGGGGCGVNVVVGGERGEGAESNLKTRNSPPNADPGGSADSIVYCNLARYHIIWKQPEFFAWR